MPLLPKNAWAAIDVTFAGIFTTLSDPLPLNAAVGIDVICDPNVMEVKEEFDAAKLGPNKVTEFGIFKL